MNSNRTPLQHGEIVLMPVDTAHDGTTQSHTNFIVAHSKTGHHHVIESDVEFEVTTDDKDQLYLRLFAPASLVHKKTEDFHPTLPVAPGLWKLYHKTEFDLWEDIIREVRD